LAAAARAARRSWIVWIIWRLVRDLPVIQNVGGEGVCCCGSPGVGLRAVGCAGWDATDMIREVL
jgi:hypothetical protein